jgi:hypothetical protein
LRLTVLRPDGGAVLGVVVAAGGALELITSGGAWRVTAPPPVIAVGLAATGTSQADALPVLAQVNVVETVPAGAGVLLPAWLSTGEITIINGDDRDLLIYPPGAARIGAAAAGIVVIVGPYQWGCFATNASTSQWYAT